jgi:uncharacterized protein
MDSGQKTETILKNQAGRVDFVDALRGFAIMSILLLHNLEHFDFYYLPPGLPDWMKSLDKSIFDVIGFLFSGKSYAIFALLFGFTFNLMDAKQAKKGYDFRLRFLWRLFLLLLFGLFNTIFYQGDILNMYALMGLAILPVCRLSDKALLWVAIVLLLQPVFVSQFIYSLFNPDYAPVEISAGKYFRLAAITQGGDSFLDMVKGNFTNGKIAVYVWSWFKGRFFQAPALFMLGMLLGRKKLLVHSPASDKFWKKTAVITLLLSLFFLIFIDDFKNLTQGFASKSLARSMSSWCNLSMTFLWVSILYLLYKAQFARKALNKLIPFGRMSLSSYVMQSILGAFIYYGFALGLYQYTGASYSLLIGIILFLFQGWFCSVWLKTHSRGPLESLWHKLTWLNYKK